MQVKNPEIFSLIESIGEHFRTNIGNRYIRKAISSMVLEAGQWELIESLTEKSQNYRYQGYHLDELYSQILAVARFVYQVRRDILPNLRYLVQGSSQNKNPVEADRVYREMAVTNFGSNLKILADQVNMLYFKTVQIDKESADQKSGTVFTRIPELQELGRYLVE